MMRLLAFMTAATLALAGCSSAPEAATSATNDETPVDPNVQGPPYEAYNINQQYDLESEAVDEKWELVVGPEAVNGSLYVAIDKGPLSNEEDRYCLQFDTLIYRGGSWSSSKQSVCTQSNTQIGVDTNTAEGNVILLDKEMDFSGNFDELVYSIDLEIEPMVDATADVQLVINY